MLRRLWVLPMLLTLAAWEPLRSPDKDVAAGNRAYAEGKLDDALAAYERAKGSGVDEAGLAYNIGTAKLALADQATDPATKEALTQEGMEALSRAATSKDPHVRSQASFNAGNAQLAGGQFPEAIDSYKQSLRDNPNFDDARANLELALRKLEKQQDQKQNGNGQGQPPPQTGQGQGQGQGQQPPPPNGQGQGQGQPGNPPPQNGSGQDQPPPQNGSGQDQPPPQNGSGQDQPPPQNGSGQDQPPPQNGSGQDKPPPQNGSGQDQPPPQTPPPPGTGQGSGQQPDDPNKPHGLPSRHRDDADDGPRTRADEKLEDLEKSSRDLRRGKATGGKGSRGGSSGVDW